MVGRLFCLGYQHRFEPHELVKRQIGNTGHGGFVPNEGNAAMDPKIMLIIALFTVLNIAAMLGGRQAQVKSDEQPAS